MTQIEVQIGDKIEFMGKKYRVELEEESDSCVGCAFCGYSPCPMGEICIARSFIFKEVKDVPRRHIELGVVKVEGDNVTFKIIEQTHRNEDFCQQTELDIFEASNEIVLKSRNIPEWRDDESTLFCRGYILGKDSIEIVCTTAKFAKISEAVNEYNITDGKGYEKPWPITCDSYYYVNENCTVGCNTFNACDYDCELQKLGNFFRTEEEAMSAAEKVKALFKKMAERVK